MFKNGSLAFVVLMLMAVCAVAVTADPQKAAVPAKAKATVSNEWVICPVEHTKIRKSQAYETTVYKGQTYYFCCAGCKPAFLKNPQKYIRQTAAAPGKK
jgi:YHS domain-containing protein